MSLLARLPDRLRRKPQQPVLDEHEAYERCHGERRREIQVMPAPRPMPRMLPRLGGDYLRRCFEERLEARQAGRGRHLRDGVERAIEPVLERGVRPQDDRLAGRVHEDPLELLRGEAVAAAHGGGRDDAVEPLGLPEALKSVGGGPAGLDARVHV
jgi:hypothetical protein